MQHQTSAKDNVQSGNVASSVGQSRCLDNINWPPLIDVTDVSSEYNSPLLGSPKYVVQSPLSPMAEESVEEENVVEPRVSERNKTTEIGRASCRERLFRAV